MIYTFFFWKVWGDIYIVLTHILSYLQGLFSWSLFFYFGPGNAATMELLHDCIIGKNLLRKKYRAMNQIVAQKPVRNGQLFTNMKTTPNSS